MQSRAVVKANDVVSHIGHGFIVVGVVFLPDPLHLQVQKEALHDRVDPALPASAHAACDALGFEQLLKLVAGVLGFLGPSGASKRWACPDATMPGNEGVLHCGSLAK